MQVISLLWGLLVLAAADLVLASSTHWTALLGGIGLWGIHMGMTQGLLATMVADTAPADLRGTAYGFFNLLSGLALNVGLFQELLDIIHQALLDGVKTGHIVEAKLAPHYATLERVAKARRDASLVEPVKAALSVLAAIYARLLALYKRAVAQLVELLVAVRLRSVAPSERDEV